VRMCQSRSRLNRNAWHQKHAGDGRADLAAPPAGAGRMSQARLLEDYAKNRGFDRDRLLLACVQHTAGHRKYGDFLACGRRYGRAMGVASLI